MTHPDILISIIVPCYNQGKYLAESLNSVLQQEYKKWECIIVNDGSNDNTEMVALEYCSKDDRFRYISQTNKGLSSARNRGIDEALGVYLQFLDADDLLLPGKIQSHVNQIVEITETDFSVSGYQLFNKSNSVPFDTALSLRPYNCSMEGFLYSWNIDFVFPPVCYFVNAEFIQSHNLKFNEEVGALEDWIFLVQAKLSDARFNVIDKPLCLYRRHESNMSNDPERMSKHFIKATYIIYDLLPARMKPIYIDSIHHFIIHGLRNIFQVDVLSEKANSFEYIFGKKILIPFHLINNILIRVVNKLKNWKKKSLQ